MAVVGVHALALEQRKDGDGNASDADGESIFTAVRLRRTYTKFWEVVFSNDKGSLGCQLEELAGMICHGKAWKRGDEIMLRNSQSEELNRWVVWDAGRVAR